MNEETQAMIRQIAKRAAKRAMKRRLSPKQRKEMRTRKVIAATRTRMVAEIEQKQNDGEPVTEWEALFVERERERAAQPLWVQVLARHCQK